MLLRLLALAVLLLLLLPATSEAASVGSQFTRAAERGLISYQEASDARNHFNQLKTNRSADFVYQRSRISKLAREGKLAARAKGFSVALRAYVVLGDKPIGTRYKVGDVLTAQRVAGAGWQFHPLASAGALNGLANSKLSDERLYRAGLDLARASFAYRRFEYQFPLYGNGPGWISGMAQAVAASAFARLYKRSGSKAFYRAALLALEPMYLAPPQGTTLSLAGGSHSLLYPFRPNLRVANAQLWAALSVDEVAETTESLEAARLADSLLNQSKQELPLYASGSNWTLYAIGSDSLAGKAASVNYHQLTVQALRRLCQRRPGIFCDYAARYGKEVPLSLQTIQLLPFD